MKSKLEKGLDAAFSRVCKKLKTYHYTLHVAPFNGITIVSCSFSWDIGRRRIDEVLIELWNHEPAPATKVFRLLHEENIWGISICDQRDNFSKQRGRIIAKGRLLKHLKELEK